MAQENAGADLPGQNAQAVLANPTQGILTISQEGQELTDHPSLTDLGNSATDPASSATGQGNSASDHLGQEMTDLNAPSATDLVEILTTAQKNLSATATKNLSRKDLQKDMATCHSRHEATGQNVLSPADHSVQEMTGPPSASDHPSLTDLAGILTTDPLDHATTDPDLLTIARSVHLETDHNVHLETDPSDRGKTGLLGQEMTAPANSATDLPSPTDLVEILTTAPNAHSATDRNVPTETDHSAPAATDPSDQGKTGHLDQETTNHSDQDVLSETAHNVPTVTALAGILTTAHSVPVLSKEDHPATKGKREDGIKPQLSVDSQE